MKKLFYISLLLIFVNKITAQVETKNLNIAKLVPEQNYLINGTANAALAGGRDRITIPVYLPEGTKEWVYVFSCSSSDNGQGVIQLCSNLTKAVDVSGTTSGVINSLTAPDGDSYCDVFLFDKENKELFENDQEGYRSYNVGTKKNIKNGVMPINNLNNGTYYIGIKNNYATTAINIKIEVAALVEQTEVDFTQWSVEKKNEMYQAVKDGLIQEGMEETNAKKLASCVIKKIVADTSIEAINKMADFEREEFFNKIEADCKKEMEN